MSTTITRQDMIHPEGERHTTDQGYGANPSAKFRCDDPVHLREELQSLSCESLDLFVLLHSNTSVPVTPVISVFIE